MHTLLNVKSGDETGTNVNKSLGSSSRSQTSETISDSAECYAGLSVRFEPSAACK